MKDANTLLQQAADFLRTASECEDIQKELRERKMRRTKALKVLHRLQRFRRGRDSFSEIGYSTKEIGEAIDVAIREMRKLNML